LYAIRQNITAKNTIAWRSEEQRLPRNAVYTKKYVWGAWRFG